jgi:hypothetical protein
MSTETHKKDLHILIKEFPVLADDVLNVLSATRRVPKWQVIRDALIEYASKHTVDIKERT